MTVNPGRNKGGTPGRIVDLCTSNFDEWFTAYELGAEFERRWPGTSVATIMRALYHLRAAEHPDLEFDVAEVLTPNDRLKQMLIVKGKMP